MAALTIQNVVVTATICPSLCLPRLVRALPCAEYNAKRFAAVTARLVRPKTTALFFSSGKVVCTGARTVNAARLALQKFARLVAGTGVRVCVCNITIQNVVGAARLATGLDLERLRASHSLASSYEPELFPGLIFRPLSKEQNVVFLVFRSGRVVVTGGKTAVALSDAWTRLETTLAPFADGGVDDEPEEVSAVVDAFERIKE